MNDLLKSWPQVSPRFRRADSIALFLDFDGTLAGFRPKPEDVLLNPHTRRAIQRLTQMNKMHVCVITGRRLSDIRDRIGIHGIRYLGLQGWEESVSQELSKPSQAFLRQAHTLLVKRINGTPGLRIENKGATIALHYRGADDADVALGRTALRTVLDLFSGCFRIMEGDCVYEILPAELAGKGIAARHEWMKYPGALPVYVGNDATDEPAFAELSKGVTVRVGRTRKTHARFHLSSPSAVRTFLEKLVDECRH